jgi:hypothetical protein
MKSVLERYEEVVRYLKRGSDIDDNRARNGRLTGVGVQQLPVSSHYSSIDTSRDSSHDRSIDTSRDRGHSARAAAIHSVGEGVGTTIREHLEGFDNYSISLNYDVSGEDEGRQGDSALSAFFDHRHSRREGIKASSGSDSGRIELDVTVCEDTCACWLRQLTASVPVLLPVCAHMSMRYRRCFYYDTDYEAVP